MQDISNTTIIGQCGKTITFEAPYLLTLKPPKVRNQLKSLFKMVL